MCAKRVKLDRSWSYLGINERVLGTRNEDKAFDLGEVGQFGGIELADADRVRFLVGAG